MQRTMHTRKPHFPQLEKIDYPCQAEISYESGKVPFNQLKVSGNTNRAKKASSTYDKVLRKNRCSVEKE